MSKNMSIKGIMLYSYQDHMLLVPLNYIRLIILVTVSSIVYGCSTYKNSPTIYSGKELPSSLFLYPDKSFSLDINQGLLNYYLHGKYTIENDTIFFQRNDLYKINYILRKESNFGDSSIVVKLFEKVGIQNNSFEKSQYLKNLSFSFFDKITGMDTLR